MNISLITSVLVIYLISSVQFLLHGQIPVDNPYLTRYRTEVHWTNQLPWKNVINAAKVEGLIKQSGTVDSTALHNTILQISTQGGGVLYFPEGNYYFNYDVQLSSGVLLRGDNPQKYINASNNNYRPRTRFIFPQYIPSFKGKGTPNSSAFKKIHGGKVERYNIGVINIDINRAMIDFNPLGDLAHNNVIVYGVRSNNVAIPLVLNTVDKRQAWQRLPDPNKENIVIVAKNNGLIANCRVNDSITDDFLMPNFMTNEGYVFTTDTIKFQHASHRAIGMFEKEVNENNTLEVLDNYAESREPLAFWATRGIQRNNEWIEKPFQDLIDITHLYSKPFQDSVKNSFESLIYIKNSKDTLLYKLLKPKNYDPKKKYPLMLYFHGIGEKGLNNNPLLHFVYLFAKRNISDNHPYFVLVPHLHRSNGQWETRFKVPTGTFELSMDVVKETMRLYSIDKERTYVAGLSYGGGAVRQTLLLYPKLFKNAVLMSSIFQLSGEQWKQIKNISFFISSGSKDEFLPVEYAKLFVNELRRRGNQVNYYEYPTDHLTWMHLCHDENFIRLINK